MKLLLAAFVVFIAGTLAAHAQQPSVKFHHQPGTVQVQIGDREIAKYVYDDPQIGHPYWTDVKTFDGVQVTRNHPPIQGEDAEDHPGFHTGIWLAFGDLSGNDYWRLKAKVRHAHFELSPEDGEREARFRVVNQYLSADGETVIANETAEFCWTLLGDDWLLEWDSTFTPFHDPLVFGDQEEMGLGIRVATPLAVSSGRGGRLLDSEGRRNGDQIWGKTAPWCDYSGLIDGQWVGMTVLTSPENFRPSWCHARDYGFLAMNPFGRKAFTGGEASRVNVQAGESLRLRFGILVHQCAREEDFSVEAAWQQFTR